MLNWTKQFNIFCLADSLPAAGLPRNFQWMLAAGAKQDIVLQHPVDFTAIDDFHKQHPGWLFGHVNYPQPLADEAGFPPAYFFQPLVIIRMELGNTVSILVEGQWPHEVFFQIMQCSPLLVPEVQTVAQAVQQETRDEYLLALQHIKQHLHRGDCYELNYCIGFAAQHAKADPWYLYTQLTTISPNPFSSFYRWRDAFCLCASPERFIERRNNRLRSQPIKGTARRVLDDPQKDAAAAHSLATNAKERAENVMVVDLVRNDLSRIAQPGSVKVDELFGIYAFPQVFQMISSISASIAPNIGFADVMEACFPMGSMTGAPKKRVMELIDQYEIQPRGLFSGCIGYIEPGGDFDFNVVIRSLFFNADKQRLGFKAGSGITFYANAEAEYEECLVKAEAIQQLLKQSK